MSRIKVNIEQYLSELEGDVGVDTVYTIVDDAQVRDYMDGNGELVRRDYTVAIWGHDGISCVDVWITKDGCIDVYPVDGNDEVEDDDNLFMSVYTSTHASLRMDAFEIPDELCKSFLATATKRMDYKDE